jgi:hypothetical protein
MPLPRLHLFEFGDQPWCPRAIRDAQTDYLQCAIETTRMYDVVAPRLARAVKRSGKSRIVDLCSGGAGPWPGLRDRLAAEGAEVTVLLTDKFPNRAAFERAARGHAGTVTHESQSIDVTAIPARIRGFRTLFSSFHHFRPAEARAILRDAITRGEPVAVIEATQRSVKAILLMFLTPITVWILTPRIRPWRWSRFLLTYPIPIVPFVVLFDGVVSCFRTYTPRELEKLAAGPEGATTEWEIAQERTKGNPVPITIAIGIPHRR